MKTILISYGEKTSYKKTKYTFNTSADVKVGDLIKSPNYNSVILVEEILGDTFNYVNTQTGELTNKINSTRCVPIRELVIRNEEKDVVYGSFVNKDE